MRFRVLPLLAGILLLNFSAIAQKDPAWDDTQSKNWPSQAKRISIPSSADGKQQMAYYYQAPNAGQRPLIVSLHTWSGDFRQKDTLIHFCMQRGYHYIHPDFRGPNQNPEALGSDLVVSDIDDAIQYALSHAAVDPDNIHVIGVSGGGHATAMTYMKSKHNIRSFSAYVGIYNLIDWYGESSGRGNKYAGDIAAATTGDRNRLDIKEAKKRSPFFQETPVEKRKNSTLYLYCGIHDGYTGSVPVSQTLRLYNKIAADFQPDARQSFLPDEFIETMVKNRSLPGMGDHGLLLGRKIIYKNHYKDKVRLTVFEGSHEMPPGDVLAHVPSRNILAIGDSNGAMENGWGDQLQELRPQDRVINACISGNTIGFDNLGRSDLNTLKNIGQYLDRSPGKLNAVIVMLGTNDCKAVFDDDFDQIPQNLESLVKSIRKQLSEKPALGNPEIYLVSPPPYGPDEKIQPKYHGAARKVAALSEAFKKVALRNNVNYIDTHARLTPVFPYVSMDGVHLTAAGQAILASMLDESLK